MFIQICKSNCSRSQAPTKTNYSFRYAKPKHKQTQYRPHTCFYETRSVFCPSLRTLACSSEILSSFCGICARIVEPNRKERAVRLARRYPGFTGANSVANRRLYTWFCVCGSGPDETEYPVFLPRFHSKLGCKP